MSPEPAPTQGTDKTVIYLLGAIVVLLVVIIAVFVVKSRSTAVPGIAQAPIVSPAPVDQKGLGPSNPTAGFDPATATKVPAGQAVDKYVSAYYKAILAKKWEVAFKMQPAASQKSGTAADFQATQTGYGMKSFEIAGTKTQGDVATVAVEQDLDKNGIWSAVWTFEKYKGGWVVKSRDVTIKGP